MEKWVGKYCHFKPTPNAYATGSELFRVEEPAALATMEGGRDKDSWMEDLLGKQTDLQK